MSGQNFRPSSRDGKPKTGEMQFYQQKNIVLRFPNIEFQQYQLQLVNLHQDEQTFASQLKLDLMGMQEEINRLDMDGKLRSGERSELSRPHIRQIRSWLQQYSNSNIKSIVESKMNSPVDAGKLIETLNVKNSQYQLTTI